MTNVQSVVKGFRFRLATAADRASVEVLVRSVLAEHGLRPDPSVTDNDLQDTTASYDARGGTFLVIVGADDNIVGCGGLYPLSQDEAEIRKMYLLAQARGIGLGRQLLQALLSEARARGFKRVVLETATVLRKAIALYTSFGFVPYQRGHVASRCDRAFVLELSGTQG